MRIRIQSDGIAWNLSKGRRLGNVISQSLAQMGSGSKIQLEIELPNTHNNIGGVDPTTGQLPSVFSPRNSATFRPDKDRVAEVCQAIRAQMDQVSVIRFCGAGEPFWQDLIFSLCTDLGFPALDQPKLFLATNGTLLNAERTERWLEVSDSCEVSFCLDAATAETYFRIHHIAELERTVANVDHFCRTRNPDQHVAVLRNSVNLWNIDELEEMVRMTRDHFFHFLALSPSVPYQKSLREVCLNRNNRNQFVEARIKTQRLADQLGVNVAFSDDWPS